LKTKTISKLKKELDKVFSLYIRLRNATPEGLVKCFTCGKIDHYKRMHAGHFQSRKYLSTRWNEENVMVQCPRCNLFAQGEQYTFGKLLDVRIGEGTAEKLTQLATKTTLKLSRIDYEELIDKFKNKLKDVRTNLS
tara:strand:+ start:406 stop:813 length:408 start_codon:yes stop_codon:yes gene_type:complete